MHMKVTRRFLGSTYYVLCCILFVGHGPHSMDRQRARWRRAQEGSQQYACRLERDGDLVRQRRQWQGDGASSSKESRRHRVRQWQGAEGGGSGFVIDQVTLEVLLFSPGLFGVRDLSTGSW